MPPSTPKAHFPRPNGAHTHCIECGRPVAKSGRAWRHKRRDGAGRPPSKPRQPLEAYKAQAKWAHAQQGLKESFELRDEAFREMAHAGMVANQIALATGLTPAGVRHKAEWLGVNLRTLQTRSPRTVIKRRVESGSVLFGD